MNPRKDGPPTNNYDLCVYFKGVFFSFAFVVWCDDDDGGDARGPSLPEIMVSLRVCVLEMILTTNVMWERFSFFVFLVYLLACVYGEQVHDFGDAEPELVERAYCDIINDRFWRLKG